MFDVALGFAIKVLFGQDLWFVGGLCIALAVALHVALLVPRLRGLRWIAPSLAFLIVFTVAPMMYTAYVGFTNYSGVHLLTKSQALEALGKETILKPGAEQYRWAAYQSSSGDYALWLVPAAAGGDALLVRPGDEPSAASPGADGVSALGADGFPESIEGFTRLSRIDAVTRIGELTSRDFGRPPQIIRIRSLDEAAAVVPRYQYDSGADVLTDAKTGTEYRPVSGTFVAADGDRLAPAFQTFTGLDTPKRLLSDSAIRGPFLRILVWTVFFAVVVVVIQFVVGLFFAVALTHRDLPSWVSKGARSILLLPYVIPAYLMILAWRAILNQQLGVVPRWLDQLFGLDPGWVVTPNGARLAMLMVGLWLGWPYFLLINSGALQSIPTDLTEAATVDGAGPWMRFRAVVLPMLMRVVAPLAILAIAFNFNNFLLGYLLFQGGPPMPDARVPAGQTDLLISFTYKLSFATGGNDYALAALMTLAIFVVLVPFVLAQLRYYDAWLQED